jgi:hypothetical protein
LIVSEIEARKRRLWRDLLLSVEPRTDQRGAESREAEQGGQLVGRAADPDHAAVVQVRAATDCVWQTQFQAELHCYGARMHFDDSHFICCPCFTSSLSFSFFFFFSFWLLFLFCYYLFLYLLLFFFICANW